MNALYCNSHTVSYLLTMSGETNILATNNTELFSTRPTAAIKLKIYVLKKQHTYQIKAKVKLTIAHTVPEQFNFPFY